MTSRRNNTKFIVALIIAITLLIAGLINVFAGMNYSYEISINSDGSANPIENQEDGFKITRKIIEEESTYNKVAIELSIKNIKPKLDSDVAILMDTSGSASGNRIENAKEPTKQLVENIFESISGVSMSYSTYYETKIAMGRNKADILTAIDETTSDGNWLYEGLNVAKNSFVASTNNKCIIVITDNTDNISMVQSKISELKEQGIIVYKIIIDEEPEALTSEENTYILNNNISTIGDTIIQEIKERDNLLFLDSNKLPVGVTDIFSEKIKTYFNFEYTTPEIGTVVANNSGYVWNDLNNKICPQETAILKYTLTLKEGIKVSSTDLNLPADPSSAIWDTNTALTTTINGINVEYKTYGNENPNPKILINDTSEEQTIKTDIELLIVDKDNVPVTNAKYDVIGTYVNKKPVFSRINESTNSEGKIIITDVDVAKDLVIEIKPTEIPAKYKLVDSKYLVFAIELTEGAENYQVSAKTTDTLKEKAKIVKENEKLIITAEDKLEQNTFTIAMKTLKKSENGEEELELSNVEYQLTLVNTLGSEESKIYKGKTTITGDVFGTGEYTYILEQNKISKLFNKIEATTMTIRFGTKGEIIDIIVQNNENVIFEKDGNNYTIIAKTTPKENIKFNLNAIVKEADSGKVIQGVKYTVQIISKDDPNNALSLEATTKENGMIQFIDIPISGLTEIRFTGHNPANSLYKKETEKSITVYLENGKLIADTTEEIYKSLNPYNNTITVSLTNQIKKATNQIKLNIVDKIDKANIQAEPEIEATLKPYGATTGIASRKDTDGGLLFDEVYPEYGEGEYFYIIELINLPTTYEKIDAVRLKITFDKDENIIAIEEKGNSYLLPITANSFTEITDNDDELIKRISLQLALQKIGTEFRLQINAVDSENENIKINNASYYCTIKENNAAKGGDTKVTGENGTDGQIEVSFIAKENATIILRRTNKVKGYQKEINDRTIIISIVDGKVYGIPQVDGTNLSNVEIINDQNIIKITERYKKDDGLSKTNVIFNITAKDEQENELLGTIYKISMSQDIIGTDPKDQITNQNQSAFSIENTGEYFFEITQTKGKRGYQQLGEEIIKYKITYKEDEELLRNKEAIVINGAEKIFYKMATETFNNQTGVYDLIINLEVKNPSISSIDTFIIKNEDVSKNDAIAGAEYNYSVKYEDEDATDKFTGPITTEGYNDSKIMLDETVTITLKETSPAVNYNSVTDEIVIKFTKDEASGDITLINEPTNPNIKINIDQYNLNGGKTVTVTIKSEAKLDINPIPLEYKGKDIIDLKNYEKGTTTPEIYGAKYDITIKKQGIDPFNQSNIEIIQDAEIKDILIDANTIIELKEIKQANNLSPLKTSMPIEIKFEEQAGKLQAVCNATDVDVELEEISDEKHLIVKMYSDKKEEIPTGKNTINLINIDKITPTMKIANTEYQYEIYSPSNSDFAIDKGPKTIVDINEFEELGSNIKIILTEITPGSGYLPLSGDKTIIITFDDNGNATFEENNDDIEIEINNNINDGKDVIITIESLKDGAGQPNPDVTPYSIKLIKESKENNAKLQGARYDFWVNSPVTMLDLNPTDGNGMLEVKNLQLEGNVSIKYKEIEAPMGYILDEEARTFNIFVDPKNNYFIRLDENSIAELEQKYGTKIEIDNINREIIITEKNEVGFCMNIKKLFGDKVVSGTKFKITAYELDPTAGLARLETAYEIIEETVATNEEGIINVGFKKEYKGKTFEIQIEEIDTPIGKKGNPTISILAEFENDGIVKTCNKSNNNSEYILSLNKTGKVIQIELDTKEVDSLPEIKIKTVDKLNNNEILSGVNFKILAFEEKKDTGLSIIPIEDIKTEPVAKIQEDGSIIVPLQQGYAFKTIWYKLTQTQAAQYYKKIVGDIELKVTYDGEGNVATVEEKANCKVEGKINNRAVIIIENELNKMLTMNIIAKNKNEDAIEGKRFKIVTLDEQRTSSLSNSSGEAVIDFCKQYIGTTITYTIDPNDVIGSEQITIKVTYDEFGNITQVLPSNTNKIKNITYTNEEIKTIDFTFIVTMFNIQIKLTKDALNENSINNAIFEITTQGKENDVRIGTTDENGNVIIQAEEVSPTGRAKYTIKQTQTIYGFTKAPEMTFEVTYDVEGKVLSYTPQTISNVAITTNINDNINMQLNITMRKIIRY